MGILCVFCVYDTIGNRCFEKTSFPKIKKKKTTCKTKFTTKQLSFFIVRIYCDIRESYCMVCASVREDNPRALATYRRKIIHGN